MKYIVYLTKNLKCKINGINRIYIGVHATENPEIFDGYIGCGVKIQQPSTYMYPKSPFQYAVKKYGVSAFERTILFIYNNAEEAYLKEAELVNQNFLNLDYTYNVALGGQYEERFKPLYQYDLNGNLIKLWKTSKDAYEFFEIPAYKFDSPKKNKSIFLNSYWSSSPITDFSEYSKTKITKITYLYTKNGKLIKEFESQTQCAEYINYDKDELSRAIKQQTLIKKQYYVSDKLVDEFIPCKRKNYINMKFYVYKDSKLISECIGKELMNIIDLHSWNKINHIFAHNKNWYKDYYISTEPTDTIPNKRIGNGIAVDVYDKYGNFIETIKSIKEVKEKYNVPASKIKNIQFGDKYFENYIFKYNSK